MPREAAAMRTVDVLQHGTIPPECNRCGVKLLRSCWKYQVLLNCCAPASTTPKWFAQRYSHGTGSEACNALDLESDGRPDSVRVPTTTLGPTGSPSGSSAPSRLAICVTGQLRGFPLSLANWRRASLLRVLRAGRLEVDWFVVAPNSTSFENEF